MKKLSWGVLSTANIGLVKVIPGMQQGKYTSVNAIASRDKKKAEEAAAKLNIPKAYGSYEELLDDREIQAVYIPLPNHMHIPWTIRCLEAGKHVLLEKPLAMNTAEAIMLKEKLKEYPDLKAMEAFMYRFHPRWEKLKSLLQEGEIGKLTTMNSVFCYYNVNPDDIRNINGIGGGGLLDIGCYCISFSRLVFNSEPVRVCGSVEYDPVFKTDRLATGILEFADGRTASIMCSTQLMHQQYAKIYGSHGRIEIDMTFTPALDSKSKFTMYNEKEIREISFDACNQYTLQGDQFSLCIMNDSDLPISIDDGIANLKIIEAIVESSKTNKWILL